MGTFKHLVDSPAKIEAFKARYHIQQEVALRYCALDQLLTHRVEGEVIIPMIPFIKGGMILPMGRITWDYLINHRLCHHQCALNLFRVLGSIDTLNEHLESSLGMMWSICTSATHSLTWGFTSSPDRLSLGSSQASPNLIRVWKTTTW